MEVAIVVIAASILGGVLAYRMLVDQSWLSEARELNNAGEFEAALKKTRLRLDFLGDSQFLRRQAEGLALLGLGRIDEGVSRLQLAGTTETFLFTKWPFFLNETINSLITAGRYREALAVAPLAEPDALPSATREDWNVPLVQINLAEAEYNLGLWEPALERMKGLDERASRFAITRAGLNLQRAWILAHVGRGSEAWSCAELIAASELPEDFRTERHYSRAAAHLACSRIVESRREVEEGLAIVRRPSANGTAGF